MNLFQHGFFTLSSGGTSDFKIECDALTDSDWDCLALLARKVAEPYSAVVGIPRGGLPLSTRLEPYITPGANRLLLVDDVYTTGKSMEKARESWPFRNTPVVGVVVFARSPCQKWWITPLFSLNHKLQEGTI